MNKIQFEKVNIVDILVIIGLGIGLIMAIIFAMNELSIGIVGVLGGYIGGASRPQLHKSYNEEKGNGK